MKIKIFYSWQSSTPKEYNWNYIRECIDECIIKFGNNDEYKEIEFEILASVEEEPGMPPVADNIIEARIPNCDIFIGDLSFVNYRAKWKRLIYYIMGDKHIFHINENVNHEFAVARSYLSSEAIITILNNQYGSSLDKDKEFPFDIRHLESPVEYRCNKRNVNNKIDKAKFINSLFSKLKVTVNNAIINKKDRFKPFCHITDWSKNISEDEFYENERITQIEKQIIEEIGKPNTCIRVLGLSGLGKTRIIFEILNRNISNNSAVQIRDKVLYLDYNKANSENINELVLKIIEKNEECIIVVDNCTQEVNRQLVELVIRKDSKLTLITINSNPEEQKINKVSDIIIKKGDLTSIVTDIVEKKFSFLQKQDKDLIIKFSEGIPLMAVLLCESISNPDNYRGELTDKKLLDNLLGRNGRDDKTRKILRAAALFNYFGYEKERLSQMRFIARNSILTNIQGDDTNKDSDFYAVCNGFLKREIFEKRGRYIGMRPFPLALYLAEEWLENCLPNNFETIIANIVSLSEPDNKELSSALVNQMKYLQRSEKAKEIVNKIVCINSPFDNEKVLNTDLGSQLFLSFVEVNPIAISENMVRNFLGKSKEELLQVKAGRRNLIWTLEKLCFDKRTFADSVKVLYAFADAENETWGNNATNQFLQLFRIQLAGTEANLDERWKIIEWGLKRNDNISLILRAMEVGLKTRDFCRSLGAENQGMVKLKDYVPKTNEEVRDYWSKILEKLLEIIKNKDDYFEQACGIVIRSIRGLFSIGCSILIFPIIEKVSIIRDNDWNEAIRELKFVKKFEIEILKEAEIDLLENLINKLTKSDFISRYKEFAANGYVDGDYSREKIDAYSCELADAFVYDNTLDWSICLEMFYTLNLDSAYIFGQRILEKIKNNNGKLIRYIDLSISVLKKIDRDKRNVNVFLGFLRNLDEKIKEDLYKDIFKDDDLNYFLYLFIIVDVRGGKYLHYLFDLVDNKKLELNEFLKYNYNEALNSLNYEDLVKFKDKLFSYGVAGYGIAFNQFEKVAYFKNHGKDLLYKILKECIYKLGIEVKEKGKIENYRWGHLICDMLKYSHDKTFAIFINNAVINYFAKDNYYIVDSDISDIYKVLIKNYFEEIWMDLSEALLSKNDLYLIFFKFKKIIGSELNSDGQQIGILFGEDKNIDEIFKWCRNKKPLAPARLSELIPIYGSRKSKIHPLAKRLIDEFGDIEEVMDGINCNMGCYTCWGSVIDILESKKELLNTLVGHNISDVDEWAKRQIGYTEQEIKRELQYEDELGIK